MASINLTRSAIAMISSGVWVTQPILQVSDIRLVNTEHSTTETYRMLLSDGDHIQQAMLARQMNSIVKEGRLQKESIVQLNEFICNVIQGRRIIIVINLEVLSEKCKLIGEPKIYDNSLVAPQYRTTLHFPSSGVDPQGVPYGNPQSRGASHASNPVAVQNMMIGTSINQKTGQIENQPSYGGAMPGKSMGTANSLHPKAEVGPENSCNSYINGGVQNQRFSNTASGGFRPPGNTYVRSGQPAYQQQPPIYSNMGPIAKNEAPALIVPIAALNPYQGGWTIKARVTSKGELRVYNNPRGEGKVFSFDLLDSKGGEIRATCFNLVADQFYDQIEYGKVYLISKGSLKPAQKNFNHLNSDYEIVLETTSTIQPCYEDNSIPKQQSNFRPISEIESAENNSMVDLLLVVTSLSLAPDTGKLVSEIFTVMTKLQEAGKNVDKLKEDLKKCMLVEAETAARNLHIQTLQGELTSTEVRNTRTIESLQQQRGFIDKLVLKLEVGISGMSKAFSGLETVIQEPISVFSEKLEELKNLSAKYREETILMMRDELDEKEKELADEYEKKRAATREMSLMIEHYPDNYNEFRAFLSSLQT